MHLHLCIINHHPVLSFGDFIILHYISVRGAGNWLFVSDKNTCTEQCAILCNMTVGLKVLTVYIK